MNHTLVTTALDHLAAVTVAQDNLTEEYDKDPGYRDQAKIAGLHQAINYGLKRAEVNALAAQAEALEGILAVLKGQHPARVFHVEAPLTPEQAADLRAQFAAMHGGM